MLNSNTYLNHPSGIALNPIIAGFDFKGFNPTEEATTYANTILHTLFNLAPAESHGNAIIEKRGDVFQCAVDFHARCGDFVAFSKNTSLGKAIESVKDDLLRKFERWKTTRFS